MRATSLTAPNTCPSLGEVMGVSVLTLESQLGSHRCKWLHPQRKRRPFGVIWSGAKMCIDRVSFESRGNQSAFLRDVGAWSSLGRLWAKALKTSYDQEILQA